MTDIYALILTIVLGVVGIIVSFGGFAFAVATYIKASKVDKQAKELVSIKDILVRNLVLYSEGKMITGYDVLELIKKQYQCDDYTAMKIYYEKSNNK